MAEYIDRDAALRAIHGQRGPCRSFAQNQMLDHLRAGILRIPAEDVAPVVRCRDCRKFKTCGCRMVASGYDDFCSYGERKEDAP